MSSEEDSNSGEYPSGSEIDSNEVGSSDYDDLDSEVSESSEESDEEENILSSKKSKKPVDKSGKSSWGLKQQDYYNTDYLDDEMISSDAEAKEEEEEAILLQKRKARSLQEEDFMETIKRVTPTKQELKKLDMEMDEYVIPKDPSILTDTEKLELLERDSPELLKLLDIFKEKIRDLQEKIIPLFDIVRNSQNPTEEGISFLEVKFQGKEVKDHPVIKQLLRQRVLIDKLRPLDLKLKYQIDTLLKVANSSDPQASVQSLNTLRRTPNLKSFNKEGEDRIDPNAKYVAPKRQATLLKGSIEEKQRKDERKLNTLAKNKMVKLLRDEFGDQPEEEDVEVTNKRSTKEKEEDNDFTRYEEDNFQRLSDKRMSQFRDPRSTENKKTKKGAARELEDEIFSGLEKFEGFSTLVHAGRNIDEDLKKSANKRSFDDMLSLSNTINNNNNDASRKKVKPTLDSDSMNKKDKNAKKDKFMDEEMNEDDDDENEYGYGNYDEADEDDDVSSVSSESSGEYESEDDDEDDGYNGKEKKGSAFKKRNNDGEEDDTDRRKINSHMEDNKGLRRKRTKKGKQSARGRLKDKYEKALKKRSSSVQKMKDKSKPYQGETTGIRSHTVKSKQLK